MTNVNNVVGLVVGLGMIALSVVSIIGLVYLTRFAFQAKSAKLLNENVSCVDNMSKTKLNFAKVTVVVLWIQIGLAILGVLGKLFVKF